MKPDISPFSSSDKDVVDALKKIDEKIELKLLKADDNIARYIKVYLPSGMKFPENIPDGSNLAFTAIVISAQHKIIMTSFGMNIDGR